LIENNARNCAVRCRRETTAVADVRHSGGMLIRGAGLSEARRLRVKRMSTLMQREGIAALWEGETRRN
jgi:hypothetical protein